MKYLYMNEDGIASQSDAGPSNADVVMIDEGMLFVFRLNDQGSFEEAGIYAVDDSRSLTWTELEDRS